jgi:hypothetical protein
MSEFKGSKGKWEVFRPDHIGCINVRLGERTGFEGYIEVWYHHFNSKEEANFTAELIAEAGNIRQQIPFSLTELKRQRDEMVVMLNKVLLEYTCDPSTHNEIEQLLKSVTEIK